MNSGMDKVLTKKNIILLVIAFVLMFFFLVVFSTDNITNTKKNTKTEEAEIKLVTNPSRFYTVSSCINKYLLYLKDKDSNKLFTLLSPSYINKQEITAQNILEKIPLLPDSGDYNFNPRKMYEQQQSETVVKYYVFGYIEKNEFMATTPDIQTAYYTVTLDNAHLTFSITPEKGKIFR